MANVVMPEGVENTWTGGTLTIGSTNGAPVWYSANARKAWPQSGRVEVYSGATLSITNYGNSANRYIGGASCTLALHPGALFLQMGWDEFNFALEPKQKIYSDAATIWFGYGINPSRSAVTDKGAKTAGSTYVSYLYLSNGARCVGSAVRTGAVAPNSIFSASGTGTSYFDTGISIVGTVPPDATQEISFHADADAALEVAGVVTLFNNASGRKAHVNKTGPGLVRFNNAVNFGNMTDACNNQPATSLKDGGLVLGVSGCTSADLAFSFEGGALVAAGGTTNTIGAVALKGLGSIVLEDDSALSIVSASEADWATGTRLTVTGDLSRASLRFGTSASALTAAQLRKIRVNDGLRAALDENGYLYGFKPGILLIFR